MKIYSTPKIFEYTKNSMRFFIHNIAVLKNFGFLKKKNAHCSEGTTGAAARKDARRGSRWSVAGQTQACSSSPTTRSTTTRGRRSATRSPARRGLTTPRTARTVPRTTWRSQPLKRSWIIKPRPSPAPPPPPPQPQAAPPPQRPQALPVTALRRRRRWL